MFIARRSHGEFFSPSGPAGRHLPGFIDSPASCGRGRSLVLTNLPDFPPPVPIKRIVQRADLAHPQPIGNPAQRHGTFATQSERNLYFFRATFGLTFQFRLHPTSAASVLHSLSAGLCPPRTLEFLPRTAPRLSFSTSSPAIPFEIPCLPRTSRVSQVCSRYLDDQMKVVRIRQYAITCQPVF